MTRVEDVVLQPAPADGSTAVALHARESVVAALERVRTLREDVFLVVRDGFPVGRVRRGDLLVVAAADRLTRILD